MHIDNPSIGAHLHFEIRKKDSTSSTWWKSYDPYEEIPNVFTEATKGKELKKEEPILAQK